MITVALLMFAAPVGRIFAFTSGNELNPYCQGKSHEDTSTCMAFVNGAIEGMMLESGDVGLGVCLPPTVTLTQVKDVAALYLANHPEERHKSGASLVRSALRKAFPCPTR